MPSSRLRAACILQCWPGGTEESRAGSNLGLSVFLNRSCLSDLGGSPLQQGLEPVLMLQAFLSFVRAGGVLPSKAVSGDLHKVSQGGGGTHDGHRGALEVLPTALLQLRRTRRHRRRRWRPPSLYSFSLGSILSEPTGPTAAGAVGQRPTTVNLKPLRQALGASLYEKKNWFVRHRFGEKIDW